MAVKKQQLNYVDAREKENKIRHKISSCPRLVHCAIHIYSQTYPPMPRPQDSQLTGNKFLLECYGDVAVSYFLIAVVAVAMVHLMYRQQLRSVISEKVPRHMQFPNTFSAI